MTDADEPGQKLALSLSYKLGRNRCYMPKYPADCKDANDVLRRYGAAHLHKMIREAVPIVPDRAVDPMEIPFTESIKGLKSGWGALDQHLALTFPELVTVTGMPGAGKSQFVLAWVANLARLHGVKATIVQLEDAALRNVRDLKKYAKGWKDEVGSNGAEWISKHFRMLPPRDLEDDDITMDWISDLIELEAVRHGVKVIVLDPWNEIEHAFARGESETQYTNDALRHIKKLSRRYGVAIVVVTHPTKGISDKPIDEITMYDVAGSAAWANKSDHGIIICREEYSLETRVKVAKCKDYVTMGVPGIVTMEFDPRRS
jgi:twinkle protein